MSCISNIRHARVRKVSPYCRVAYGALLTLGLAASAAHAQTRETAAPDADQVGEIVVTAQFRAQNIQETPLAITAVTADLLEARSQTNIMSVAQRAPSVTFTTAGGGLGGSQTTAINIRGVGQTDFNLALEPGVGTYIDDVYYGTVYGSLMDLLDLERVEVLRGPQGTLAGKNSEGGAVKLFSRAPSAQTNGYLDATYGNYDRMQLRGGTNFTLVPDRLFFRLTGMGAKEKGYVKRYDYQCLTGRAPSPFNSPASQAKNAGKDGCLLGRDGGRDVLALRGALRFVVNEKIEDTITADITRDRSDPPPFVMLAQGTWHGPGWTTLPTGANNITPSFVPPFGSYYNFATYTGLAGTPYQYTNPAISSLDAKGISNVLDIELGPGLSLKSVSAYRTLRQTNATDQDTTPLSRLMNLWDVDYKQYTQELRLNGQIGSQVNWTLGGFYFRSNAYQNNRISLDGAADNTATFDFTGFEKVVNISRSVFAHIEVTPIDRLTLTGGVRYTKDSKDFTYGRGRAPGYPGTFLDASVLAADGLFGAFRGGKVDYRVTANYKFTDDVNGYLQVATGYKGGGVNPRAFYALQVRPFGPETVTAYEVGLKTFLFDRRLRLNMAGFYNSYKDMQLTLVQCPQFVPAGLPQNCALPANVGDAEVKGFELEAEIRPTRNLLIDVSGSYLDFQFKRVDPATRLLDTYKPPFVPSWKLAAGAQYTIDMGDHGNLTPRLDYTFTDEQYSAATNHPGNRLPPISLFNARLTYKTSKGDWQVALEATNVLNKYYFNLKTYSFPPLGNYQYSAGMVAPPRRVAVSAKRVF